VKISLFKTLLGSIESVHGSIFYGLKFEEDIKKKLIKKLPTAVSKCPVLFEFLAAAHHEERRIRIGANY